MARRYSVLPVLIALMAATTAVAQEAVDMAEPQPPANDWATLALLRCDELPLKNETDVKVGIVAKDLVLGEGKFGKAVDFSKGGTARFSLPNDAQPSDELTIECWVYLEEVGKERVRRIVGRSSNYGFYTSGAERKLKGKPAARLTYFLKSGKENETWKSVGTLLPVGQWVHLAGTYDGEIMKLYLDGKLVGEEKNPGKVRVGKGAYFLGTEAGRDEHRLLGRIDEVRISKIARTEFMTGKPAERPKPTAAWTPVDVKKNAFLPTMVVSRARRAPKIDGNLSDETWQGLPNHTFVSTMLGTAAAIPTEVKAAYDSRALYVAVRALEKGQESFRLGGTGHDNRGIFRDDCVEILLQPGGAGQPYFQIAVNPAGGICDIRWPAPRKPDWDWQCHNIRVAGVVRPDDWTVEVAVPFADLGEQAPGRGEAWRANFCRNELPKGELTAWSMTGGGFHVLKRFGVLKFGLEPVAAGATVGDSEVRGTVLESDGSPVAGAPIRTMTGIARTDTFGEFRLENVAPGELLFQIDSPRYETFTAKTTISQPLEILEPITLRRVDPYLPAWPGPMGKGSVAWLKSSIDEPPAMDAKPGAGDAARTLAILATPGEYESRAVAFFANRAIDKPSASIENLEGPGPIPQENIDVRWTQRLLKRVQYRRVREDAVFSWRFLWREPPDAIPEGRLRQLVVTVKVPDDAEAGDYRGDLVLSSEGRRVASLPVQLRVAGFKLATPEKRVGCYYGTRDLSEEQKRIELRDIREHGGTLLIWHASLMYSRNPDGTIGYDTSHVREAVSLQKEFGIGPPYIVGPRPNVAASLAGLKYRVTAEFAQEVLNSAQFREVYGGAIRTLDNLQKEMGVEFLYTWMDEVFGRGRYETWEAFARVTKELTKTRIYITFHNRKQEMVDRAAPWVDVRCYHGHTFDWWQGEGHKWEELKAELEKDGDEAWTYYNIREIAVTSEWVRLCNGYWLWRSPISAHVPWKYYSYGGSPFDDMDSDHHDFAYAAPHPSKPEMVSSLEWECYREGYDDLKYLATLEQALAKAKQRNPRSAAVRKAEALRQSYWDFESRVPQAAEQLTAADYLKRRADMTAAIETLLGVR